MKIGLLPNVLQTQGSFQDYLYYNQEVTKNNSTVYYGLVIDILQSLSAAFNFTYETVPSKTYSTAKNGLIGLLANKVVNLSAGAIIPTYDRQKFADFLTAFKEDEVGFATYQQPLTQDIFVTFQPLTLNTFLVLIVAWFISSFVIHLIVTKDGGPASQSPWCLFADIALDMFGAGFKQSVALCDNQSSCLRSILAYWNIMSVIVTTLYVSVLVAMAAVPAKPKTIDSVGELAARKEYKVLVYRGSATQESFKAAKKGPLANIWKNQILPYDNEMLSFADPASVLMKRLASGNVAIAASTEGLKALRNFDCRIHVAKKRAYGSDLAFAVQKGSRLKEKFDEHILALQRSGIMSHWISKYGKSYFDTERCQRELEKDKQTPTINVNIMVGPLLSLACGLLCSLLVLCIEKTIIKRRTIGF